MNVLLVVYDNDSYIHHVPVALTYIASALRNAGHEVKVYSQDLYHLPESHLTQYLNQNHFDVVGLGIVAGYYPYRKMLKISEAINQSSDHPCYIIGGHGPSPEPGYFLEKSGADFIVIGEGERTVVNLLDAIEHKRDFNNVKGIAYREGNQLVVNQREPLIEDIDSVPFPAWDLFPMDYYALFHIGNTNKNSDRVGTVISGRGCPFHCNFCYRMDKGVRIRSPESIIEEIDVLKKDYYMNFIYFCDELLMTSAERIYQLCEAFIKEGMDLPWSCNGRLNYAKPEIIKLMKRAGCVFINYGVECVDDTILRNMNKALTVSQITSGIETTLAEGIHPGFNIIFGNIGENRDTLQKDVGFLLKYDDQGQVRTIRPVTPYPGSPLYYYAIEKGLLKDVADFYENKHVNQDLLSVNFTELSDSEFNEALCEANQTLLANYYKKQQERMFETCRKLYLLKDATFRGFRQS